METAGEWRGGLSSLRGECIYPGFSEVSRQHPDHSLSLLYSRARHCIKNLQFFAHSGIAPSSLVSLCCLVLPLSALTYA